MSVSRRQARIGIQRSVWSGKCGNEFAYRRMRVGNAESEN